MREGLMMDDYPLSVTALVERAERYSPGQEIVFRRPDGSVGRTTFARDRPAGPPTGHRAGGTGDR